VTTFYEIIKIDDLVKSLKMRLPVIPAKAGIQYFQRLINTLDSSFHRSDNFLRIHQDSLAITYLRRKGINHFGAPNPSFYNKNK
jgi:hypothetical protein